MYVRKWEEKNIAIICQTLMWFLSLAVSFIRDSLCLIFFSLFVRVVRKALPIICWPIVCARTKGLKYRSDDRRKYFRRCRYLLNLFSRHNKSEITEVHDQRKACYFNPLRPWSWSRRGKLVFRQARDVFNERLTWINKLESEKFLRIYFGR